MADNNHPMTPPDELIREWTNKHYGGKVNRSICGVERTIATQAARWGADQELEACCEWLETGPYGFSIEATAPSMTKRLRAARRPKPKIQAEEAIAELDGIATCFRAGFGGVLKCDIIRAALERLRELEGSNG